MIQLEKQLKEMRTIAPDPAMLKWGRRALIAAIRQPAPVRGARVSLPAFVRPALALPAIAAMLVIAGGMVLMQKRDTAIASLNAAAIAEEQRISESARTARNAEYFKNVSPTVTLALNDIIDPSTNWGSADHIKKGIALMEKTDGERN
jgi:hypothetical protein